MARSRIVIDLATGEQTTVPYTQEEEDAADAAKAADDITQAPFLADQARKEMVAADANYIDLLNRAKTATPQQIDSWLTANVTNLAQARTVLGALIKAVAVKFT